MANATAGCTHPYRETVVYRRPDSEYFTVITPYLSNVRLRFANQTYSPSFTKTMKIIVNIKNLLTEKLKS